MPLYEAKMIHQFDHRFGTYEGQSGAQANQGKLPELDHVAHADPGRTTLPRYWVSRGRGGGEAGRDLGQALDDRLEGRITRERSEIRTVIACIIPRTAVNRQVSTDDAVYCMHNSWLASTRICRVFRLTMAQGRKVGGVQPEVLHHAAASSASARDVHEARALGAFGSNSRLAPPACPRTDLYREGPEGIRRGLR